MNPMAIIKTSSNSKKRTDISVCVWTAALIRSINDIIGSDMRNDTVL
jgi:hypothetical protein